MLAFGSYNPAVLTVILDRARFKPYLVTRENNWKEKLSAFLEGDEDRTKVLLIESLDLLRDLQDQQDAASEVKGIVIDMSPYRLKDVEGLTLMDMQPKDDNTWQLLRVMPDDLNDALEETPSGIAVSIPKKAEENQKENHEDCEVSRLLQTASEGLPPSVASTLKERSLNYVVGKIEKRALGGAKRTAAKNGAVKEHLEALTSYLDEHRDTMTQAYEAYEEGEVDSADLRYIIANL